MTATDMPRPNPVRLTIEAAAEVLRRPAYALLAAAIALVALAATLWLPNHRLIGALMTTPGVTLGAKLQLLANLASGLVGGLGAATAVPVVLVPVLFGVDAAMIAWFFRQRRSRRARGEIAAGLGGAAGGAIAAGCAACGSFLLLPLLSFLGAAGLLALLPLGGAELGFAGMALLLFSIWLIARKIAEPPVCALPTAGPAARGAHQPPTRDRP